MKIVLPRANANFNKQMDPSYYDYDAYTFPLGGIDGYGITQRMGRGKYSEVFSGRRVSSGSRIVIKVLKPVRPSKINREILVLKHLDHPNIIPLRDVVQDRSSGSYALIFDYVKSDETARVFESAGLEDIRHYARQILEALRYAHSRGIMHRDVKPQNIIVDSRTNHLFIIDWGLAEFYHPEQEYSVRVASRYYKGPELLVDYPYYDYSLDVWSFGCVLAELLFRKAPFFSGLKGSEQIFELIRVLGTRDLEDYVGRFEIPYEVPKAAQADRVPLASFLPEGSDSPLMRSALELLESVLVYDHSARPTAAECLESPFFQ
ncbi:casein kinase II subunit alpha [Pancytospora philotis]|nr:casein kinase II subunit alpha [Pancytospora philotis]